MKKIFFIIMCFLFVGVVNARTLTKEEIIDGFMNSTFIKQINKTATESEKVGIINNTENSTFDITAGGTVVRTYSYAEGYIHYIDDREITEVLAQEQFNDFIYLGSLMESALIKSGVDVEHLKSMDDSFVFDFDRYDIFISGEEFSFQTNNGTLSGDYIREYKIGFDTDKLNAFADAVGYVSTNPEPSSKVATIKLLSKDKNAVSLSVYVEDEDTTKEYKCNIYRSTNKISGYKKVFDESFSCTDKTAIYLDTGLKENTKYYYKASVDGYDGYSSVLEVALGNSNTNTNTNTNTNITNPKTGVNQFLPLIIGFFASIIVLFIFHKNSGIKL